MRGRGFCGLVPRLLATWYWFDHEAIEDRACARAVMEQALMEQALYYTVLVRPRGDRRVKKNVREPKWGTSSPSVIVLESEDGNKETLHQKKVRQRRKI